MGEQKDVFWILKFSVVLICLALTACVAGQRQAEDNQLAGLAKSDVDEVIEIHQQAVLRDLRTLMVKLYKRNPNQRHDKAIRTITDSVNNTFSKPFFYTYPQWKHIQKPVDLIRLAYSDHFTGDRVLAFIVGLRKMLMASYDNHTDFYYLTSIDQQKLYNSARNIETAAWLLANKRHANGQLLLLSDSLMDEKRNLSYQRLFGQMIATQDNLALIIAKKNDRLIQTFFVQAASMIFLPI